MKACRQSIVGCSNQLCMSLSFNSHIYLRCIQFPYRSPKCNYIVRQCSVDDRRLASLYHRDPASQTASQHIIYQTIALFYILGLVAYASTWDCRLGWDSDMLSLLSLDGSSVSNISLRFLFTCTSFWMLDRSACFNSSSSLTIKKKLCVWIILIIWCLKNWWNKIKPKFIYC